MLLVSIDDGSAIVLNKAVTFFGRSHECDIILSHSRKVSRKHCCVAQIDDQFYIRDLGSMNGVRVNQQLANPELPIEIGDEVWIGDVGYRLQQANGSGRSAKQKVEKSSKPLTKDPPSANREKSARDRLIDGPPPSMEQPVAIPDESREIVIEESIQQKIIDPDSVETFE